MQEYVGRQPVGGSGEEIEEVAEERKSRHENHEIQREVHVDCLQKR